MIPRGFLACRKKKIKIKKFSWLALEERKIKKGKIDRFSVKVAEENGQVR